MKALVIDDSRAMRTIIGRMLKELNMEVCDAADGQQGLSCLVDTPDIQLVLVDWNMPVMNGLEFVQAVRGNERWKAPPALVDVDADLGGTAYQLGLGHRRTQCEQLGECRWPMERSRRGGIVHGRQRRHVTLQADLEQIVGPRRTSLAGLGERVANRPASCSSAQSSGYWSRARWPED